MSEKAPYLSEMREDVQWRLTRSTRPPRSQRFARKPGVPRRRMIGEKRHERGRLFHIGLLNTFVQIHRVVVCAAVVIEGVLDKLESRQPDTVE